MSNSSVVFSMFRRNELASRAERRSNECQTEGALTLRMRSFAYHVIYLWLQFARWSKSVWRCTIIAKRRWVNQNVGRTYLDGDDVMNELFLQYTTHRMNYLYVCKFLYPHTHTHARTHTLWSLSCWCIIFRRYKAADYVCAGWWLGHRTFCSHRGERQIVWPRCHRWQGFSRCKCLFEVSQQFCSRVGC